jgi:hypothetical protein
LAADSHAPQSTVTPWIELSVAAAIGSGPEAAVQPAFEHRERWSRKAQLTRRRPCQMLKLAPRDDD